MFFLGGHPQPFAPGASGDVPLSSPAEEKAAGGVAPPRVASPGRLTPAVHTQNLPLLRKVGFGTKESL